MNPAMRLILSYLLWPGLLGLALAATGFGMAHGHGVVAFNLTYLTLAASLWALERRMPHEAAWLRDDGQMAPDLLHTLLNKGLVQVLVVVSAVMGTAEAVDPAAGPVWPAAWPLAAQVALGLVVAEFGLYWAHRLAHEWPVLWRFHAVHHSVEKLWFWNTGRFHFVDTFTSIIMSVPLLLLAGAPKGVMVWYSAVTAFIGILTHCNVEMRFGVLSWLFNTPGLHRWHHSMDLREGNRNYGENLMLWDHIFGSFINPDRRPPAIIGIKDHMPTDWVGQLKAPFMWKRLQRDRVRKDAA